MPCNLCIILNTCNPPAGAKLNFVEKWAVIIRACVFSMTGTSALIGALLGWRDGHFAWVPALLVLLGLLLAHAANNVLNDLMDYRSGVDTADYFRVQYSPHPIHSGWATQGQLLAAFLLFSGLDLALLLYFVSFQGWGVAAFAIAGFLISVLYVGGTYSLKFTGLGELAVLLVWGPLMVGGTYYVLAGSLPWGVVLASLPYALLVTTVILGKHIDKREKDAAKGIRTLPVILGHDRAMGLTKGMIIGFYVLIAAAAALGALPWASLLALGSVPRAREVWKVLSQPKPQTPPAGWAVWPLWYVGWCFYLGKLAGGLLIGGMAAEIAVRSFLR
jgi:1,4-dihydroxy-2-naphthoate polyprenyltransferase